MRFQVPQFIETEVKLVGPLTLKQFLWVAAGVAIIYLAFLSTHGGIVFFIIALPVGAIAAAFAFLKIDGIPLVNYGTYFLNYLLQSKKYIFSKDSVKINK